MSKLTDLKSVTSMLTAITHRCNQHMCILDEVHATPGIPAANWVQFARLEGDTLYLLSGNPASATRLRMCGEQILHHLQSRGYAVRLYKVSNAPEQTVKNPADRLPLQPRPEISASTQNALLSLSEQCEDQTLSKALKKLASRHQVTSIED